MRQAAQQQHSQQHSNAQQSKFGENEASEAILPQKLLSLDEDAFSAYVMEKKRSPAICCCSTCYHKVRYNHVRSQVILLRLFKQIEVPDTSEHKARIIRYERLNVSNE